MEEWRNIEGYEGDYQISNYGRVKSLKHNKERILKNQYDANDYYGVILSKNNKKKYFRIHRLVAEAFILNPNNLPEVNHKDEDKHNNIVENLEWCDRKYNCNYGERNKKLTGRKGKKVKCIETGEVFDNMKKAAEKYNITKVCISNCCKGKQKTAAGYKWRLL